MDLCGRARGRAPIKRCGADAPIRFDISVCADSHIIIYIYFLDSLHLILLCAENIFGKNEKKKQATRKKTKKTNSSLFSN